MAGGFWLGGLGITSVLSADLLALSGSDLSLKLEGLQPSVKQLARKVRGHKMVCLGGVQVSVGRVHKWVERGAGVRGDLNAVPIFTVKRAECEIKAVDLLLRLRSRPRLRSWMQAVVPNKHLWLFVSFVHLNTTVTLNETTLPAGAHSSFKCEPCSIQQ